MRNSAMTRGSIRAGVDGPGRLKGYWEGTRRRGNDRPRTTDQERQAGKEAP